MHARSTTFHGRPGNVDAGIAFIKNEVGPMLDQIEGCRGISFLVDRESGQCIATSSWESATAMQKSDDELRPMRDRGREILGGSMQADVWEIGAMHRTDHGQFCRVSWIEGDLEALTETFRVALLPQLDEVPGFCSASLLLNRRAGLACVTTAWESRAALEASSTLANEMRNRAAGDAGGAILDVQEFELAYAHLHVPELA